MNCRITEVIITVLVGALSLALCHYTHTVLELGGAGGGAGGGTGDGGDVAGG